MQEIDLEYFNALLCIHVERLVLTGVHSIPSHLQAFI